jgi:hypothetical protein
MTNALLGFLQSRAVGLKLVAAAALLLATSMPLAHAVGPDCRYYQNRALSAERALSQADFQLRGEEDRFYRTQDQVAERQAILYAQVQQAQYDANVVRSRGILYYGYCGAGFGRYFAPNVSCVINRAARRNNAIRQADVRVAQAQARYQNYVTFAQGLLQRQADRVVRAQNFVAQRQAELQQAQSDLAQCQAQAS